MEAEVLECSFCKARDVVLRMFNCTKCDAVYCSDHRLPFDHACASTSSSSSSAGKGGGGVKAMFRAVEYRFAEEDEKKGTQAFHYQVKTFRKAKNHNRKHSSRRLRVSWLMLATQLRVRNNVLWR